MLPCAPPASVACVGWRCDAACVSAAARDRSAPPLRAAHRLACVHRLVAAAAEDEGLGQQAGAHFARRVAQHAPRGVPGAARLKQREAYAPRAAWCARRRWRWRRRRRLSKLSSFTTIGRAAEFASRASAARWCSAALPAAYSATRKVRALRALRSDSAHCTPRSPHVRSAHSAARAAGRAASRRRRR